MRGRTARRPRLDRRGRARQDARVRSAALAFPRSAEAVDGRWLRDVLATPGPDGAFATPRVVERRPVGTGQMSASVRCTLEWPPGTAGPPSVVCKMPSTHPQSRETGRAMRTYEVEVSFYREIASTVGIRTPRCHFGALDPETHDFLLVLEDLAPARQGDQLAGCSAAEAALAMDELAKLHAPRWADPGAAALTWLNRNSRESLRAGAGVLPALLPGFLERYADRLLPEHVRVAEAFVGRLAEWFDARREPFTVQHGDYRLDNMLFGTPAGGPPLAVVDWQTASWGPALTDTAYFLGAGLLADERRRHERDLVHRYWTGLRAEGVGDFDWERCWREYRLYAPAGMLMAIGASMMVERTPRGDDMFVAMAERHAAQMLDLDSLGALSAAG
jgi:hypothetical protein